jgi:hypothetical protein
LTPLDPPSLRPWSEEVNSADLCTESTNEDPTGSLISGGSTAG